MIGTHRNRSGPVESVRTDHEAASISILTLGFLIVIGLLVVVVVNASAAFLQRQELNNLADGAALSAADGLDIGGLYGAQRVQLDTAGARTMVSQYLAGQDVSLRSVRIADDEVTVSLRRTLELPLVPPGWFTEASITAEASSRLHRSS